MIRRLPALVVVVTALPGGCLPREQTPLVPASPFNMGPAAPTAHQASYAQASVETAARVDTLGRRLLAANPQAGLRQVMFRTIGAPQPEIFHQGGSEVFITDGLVRQCATDGQLAAVLCTELARMVAEREILAGPKARLPEREPPINVPVGNESGSFSGAPDQTRLAELGMYERDKRRAAAQAPLPPPDPQTLARAYLTRAGYPFTDLEAVQPLLATATENSTFARQLKGRAAPARPWTGQ